MIDAPAAGISFDIIAAHTPWVQTLSGAAVDLIQPDPETIDFVNDIAPQLAIIPRFNGAAGNWFVSDHLVAGCCTLMSQHLSNKRLAAWWLLHDAHEAYIGDIITPVARALEAHATAEFADKAGYTPALYIKAAIASLKKTLDIAIHRAAGVPLPDKESVEIIRRHNLAMMMTERNHLMSPSPRSWGALENIPPLRTNGALKSTGKTAAARADLYLRALQIYCPQALRRDEVFSIPAEQERR